MRISIGILFFLLFLFSSCKTENPAPARKSWTEKDVEGYWATSNLINASDQAPYFPDAIGIKNFLRFKNTVNGEADSTFYVKANFIWTKTLFCNVPEGISAVSYCYEPVFEIRNATNEKLTLFDLKCKKEINYYNVMSMPEIGGDFNSMGLSDRSYPIGVEIRSDSFFMESIIPEMCCMCPTDPALEYYADRIVGLSDHMNLEWENTLHQLSRRVNLNTILNIRNAQIKRSYIERNENGEIIIHSSFSTTFFWVKTDAQFYLLCADGIQLQVPLAALSSELNRMTIRKNVSETGVKQSYIMPSGANFWLLDTAKADHEREIRNRY